MGVVENITADRFPEQGRYLGVRAEVLFHFAGPALGGRIVRDDREDPWVTAIHLDDGRLILATECQYRPTANLAPRASEGDSAPSTRGSRSAESERDSLARRLAVRFEQAEDLRAKLAAAKAVLAERERELLELKGPCGTCPLHFAHAGPCAPPRADSAPNPAAPDA